LSPLLSDAVRQRHRLGHRHLLLVGQLTASGTSVDGGGSITGSGMVSGTDSGAGGPSLSRIKLEIFFVQGEGFGAELLS
jgi:hypothetical protein